MTDLGAGAAYAMLHEFISYSRECVRSKSRMSTEAVEAGSSSSAGSSFSGAKISHIRQLLLAISVVRDSYASSMNAITRRAAL